MSATVPSLVLATWSQQEANTLVLYNVRMAETKQGAKFNEELLVRVHADLHSELLHTLLLQLSYAQTPSCMPVGSVFLK